MRTFITQIIALLLMILGIFLIQYPVDPSFLNNVEYLNPMLVEIVCVTTGVLSIYISIKMVFEN